MTISIKRSKYIYIYYMNLKRKLSKLTLSLSIVMNTTLKF